MNIGSLISDEERNWEPQANQNAESTFDHQYALVVWRTVQEQLRQRSLETDRGTWYEMFLTYNAPEGKRPSQEALGEQYGLTLHEVKEILKKMKNHFERLLRAEVRADGLTEDEIDEEIQQIRQYLSG